jgi:ABC-2 type transport system permease protein
MTYLPIAIRQVRYEQRQFWRNRTRAFFSFMFPLMLLVIFATLAKHDTLVGTSNVSADAFVIPGLLAYGVIMATFNNLAIELAAARDQGVLKRLRGTPMPGWVFVTARIASSVVTAAELTAVTLLVARVGYGLELKAHLLPALAVTLVVGTACFSALGIGVNGLIPNAEAAPIVANVVILPLTFFSGVWAQFNGIPSWLHRLAEVFPIQHLAHGLQAAYDPRTNGLGVGAVDMLVLAAWGLVGVLGGVWYLRRERVRA